MGNNPSQEISGTDLQGNNLVFERQVNNEHYGEAKIYKNPITNVKYALKQKFCTSKQDLNDALNEI